MSDAYDDVGDADGDDEGDEDSDGGNDVGASCDDCHGGDECCRPALARASFLATGTRCQPKCKLDRTLANLAGGAPIN